MEIVRQSLAIAIVFALLWVALRLLRKKGALSIRPAKGDSRLIESRGRLALSAQHSLHLVRVSGRDVLVGVHPSGLTVILDLAARAPGTEVSALS